MVSSAQGGSFPFQLGRSATAGLIMLGLTGCDDFRYPRDPNNTLDRVLATKRIRVAAVDHVPWVIIGEGATPQGAEVDLVQAFACDLGVTIDWQRAPAFEALEALRRGDIDLAIGGYTKSAVTAHKGVSPTYAYFTDSLIVAAEPETSVPQRLDGHKVSVAPELMAGSLIREKGGVAVSGRSEAVRLVVLPHWLAAKRGLVPTEIELRRNEHVMAVPQGENAWIMRLERFLRARAGEMDARLREHAR